MRHRTHVVIMLMAFYAMSCYGKDLLIPNYPLFYVGINAGYGSTTWDGLVPSPKNKNEVICISAPTEAVEGGVLWGVLAGVEFNPYLALEATYQQYPHAKIIFEETSLFAYDHHEHKGLTSDTDSISLVAKVMTFIPNTCARIFSGVGLAVTHRDDIVYDRRKIKPTFVFGANFTADRHWMLEVGVTYTAGDGQAELDPVKDYVPFLYSAGVRLDYRF